METFANRLEMLLSMEGLTPNQFAERMDIQRSSLSHLLKGRNNPSYDVIVKLMTFFPTVNIEWMLTGKGKPYREYNKQPHERPTMEPADKNREMPHSNGAAQGISKTVSATIPPAEIAGATTGSASEFAAGSATPTTAPAMGPAATAMGAAAAQTMPPAATPTATAMGSAAAQTMPPAAAPAMGPAMAPTMAPAASEAPATADANKTAPTLYGANNVQPQLFDQLADFQGIPAASPLPAPPDCDDLPPAFAAPIQQDKAMSPAAVPNGAAGVPAAPDPRRRVTKILIFYSDNSFEER